MEENKSKSEAALREEKVLEFWRANKIFEKSLEQTKKGKEFVYYDGPVTANSKPVLHTMVPFSFKDTIPRYRTMQGYHVRRKGGWDTHGLPVELQIEKKLDLKSKKEIEEYGIEAFNKLCKESVWEYIGLWKDFTSRMGYWADQENPYVTYHNDYIESVWNIVAEADKQKLLYKDYKVVPWCPRCGTALSSHELAQGYEEVKDLSLSAKFPIVGFPKAYFLAWTTTPWTLPGNIALAVGKDIVYVEAKVGEEILVLAKDRLSILPEGYEIIAEHKGSEMAGMQYEPIFPFLKEILEKKGESVEKAFKVYVADFVNTTDGTGIVHTAVMYGQDDFELGTKVGLPKFHLVNPDGKFISGTGFLEGRYVREEADGKPVLAVDIIKNLQERNLFFSKENYLHQYPHCWRCHTPLIYYARDSWYIRMSDPKIKNKLINENKKINWEPAHIKEGRFGEWLREIKDWAISRERYWGTPLPVWVAKDGERLVVDSLATLKKYSKKSGNKYFVMRHGEAENNARGVYSSNQSINHLTEKGRDEVEVTAKHLKSKKVTKMFASPFLRTRETAELVADSIGYPRENIIFDQRIRELGFGDFSEKTTTEFWNYVNGQVWGFDSQIPGGESYQDGKNRLGEFLYEIDAKYKNETILIVSHGLACELIPAVIEGADKPHSFQIFTQKVTSSKPASLHREHEFTPLPHNKDYELDFHRPYIDEVVLEKNGKEFHRTKEVMDVWLDSGAMPFAQDHYPAGTKKILYPADFISEAIDQTRGWFYTLHAVGTIMGRGRAFQNVICLGHLLDKDGRKMSKSVGNVVDPWEVMNKYGADTLRLWMYSVNQPGESKNFDEKTVQLLHSQVFGLLYNVLAFYELYRDKTLEVKEVKSKNILDQWILARLNELIKLSTENLDNYKLLEPTRAMKELISDLSTWYLRRSRERIKEGDKDAKATLYLVLKNIAKLLAPFAPFAAEDIWLRLRTAKDVESVHLASWPKAGKIDSKLITMMEQSRTIVSLILEQRQKKSIPVRQPLNQATIYSFSPFVLNLIKIIQDETNIKNLNFIEKGDMRVEIDPNITPELKEEGTYRELLRAIQDMRKKMGLTPNEGISLTMQTTDEGKNLVQKFENDLKKTALASLVEFKANEGEELKISDLVFKVKIDKI
jgi:isoleucyl-tRNA synthetase